MKYSRIITAFSLAFGVAASAHAGLVGVKTIEVQNGIGQWLQVAEVVALNMGAADVALSANGATASAPDTWDANSTPAKAIDGITAGDYGLGQIFHEGSPLTLDTLTITLAAIEELASIQIWGRTDGGSDRDLYTVTFRGALGQSLYSTSIDARGSNHNGFAQLPDTSQRVPEPGSIALAGLGLLGLAAARRARKS